jgi:hypothetical protein
MEEEEEEEKEEEEEEEVPVDSSSSLHFQGSADYKKLVSSLKRATIPPGQCFCKFPPAHLCLG